MSSYLFYSSPPPALYQHQQPQTSFFTPQAHRTHLHAAWSSFQPKSPSPLRTSKHANRSFNDHFMSSPAKPLAYDGLQENATTSDSVADENADTRQPFLGDVVPVPMFELPKNLNQPPKNSFQFQQRARESTSTSQLSNRIQSSRTERKNAFVNRLRQSRRDERDKRGLESFEKAEYWREKKEREERLLREAEAEGFGPEVIDEILQDEDLVQEEDQMADDRQMSPISEERELEELVNAYLQHSDHQQVPSQSEQPGSADGDSSINFDDDFGYDEVFAEVLSQQNQPRSTQEHMGFGTSTQSGDMDTEMS